MQLQGMSHWAQTIQLPAIPAILRVTLRTASLTTLPFSSPPLHMMGAHPRHDVHLQPPCQNPSRHQPLASVLSKFECQHGEGSSRGHALKMRRVPTVLNSGTALASSLRATANVKGDTL